MRSRKRLITAFLALTMIMSLQVGAMADDRGAEAVAERVTDKPVERVADKPADRPADKPTDRCLQHLTDRRCVDDRPSDRPIDRCLAVAENDRRCLDDHRPHDFNVRKLIWRLIQAHEWEKLKRLLHWLGWL